MNRRGIGIFHFLVQYLLYIPPPLAIVYSDTTFVSCGNLTSVIIIYDFKYFCA